MILNSIEAQEEVCQLLHILLIWFDYLPRKDMCMKSIQTKKSKLQEKENYCFDDILYNIIL